MTSKINGYVGCAIATMMILTACVSSGTTNIRLKENVATTNAAAKAAPPSVAADGTVHLPNFAIAPSVLASSEANKNFLDLVHGFNSSCGRGVNQSDIKAVRQSLDECLMRPGVDKLRAVFPVDIRPQRIAGVPVDVIEPTKGVSKRNRERVLINLHGGGFMVAAGLGGQMESIPIASLGGFRVISIDYREGPEHKFPAASEDVAAVYRELLKTYPAQNIGIYGCSAGGMLTAESVTWFQTHALPRPGAIGIFGSGALVPMVGDSKYVGALLEGSLPEPEDAKKFLPYFDVPELNIRDPLVSPAYAPNVLAAFPPSLLISGTRDIGLSAAVFTHSQLIKQGVDADLHVWEGASHCSFAQPIADPSVPETKQAWDVIVKFFDKHLGLT